MSHVRSPLTTVVPRNTVKGTSTTAATVLVAISSLLVWQRKSMELIDLQLLRRNGDYWEAGPGYLMSLLRGLRLGECSPPGGVRIVRASWSPRVACSEGASEAGSCVRAALIAPKLHPQCMCLVYACLCFSKKWVSIVLEAGCVVAVDCGQVQVNRSVMGVNSRIPRGVSRTEVNVTAPLRVAGRCMGFVVSRCLVLVS